MERVKLSALSDEHAVIAASRVAAYLSATFQGDAYRSKLEALLMNLENNNVSSEVNL